MLTGYDFNKTIFVNHFFELITSSNFSDSDMKFVFLVHPNTDNVVWSPGGLYAPKRKFQVFCSLPAGRGL